MNIKLNDFTRETQIRGKEYKAAFNRTLSSGYYILGNEVKEFEKEFASYLNVKYCIGVANGLEALQISLMALGIGKDDEVITTPLSAVATTLAILAVHAKPVFIDVDKDGQINLDLLEKKINKNTKAIIPVDLYGISCDLARLEKICKQNKIFLIEDAAQGHGSIFANKKLGNFGDMGCFSFYPTKNLGAIGDGGAIVTNNSKIANLVYKIRDYGQGSKYLHTEYGLNSRLDEVQAAILKIKLKYLDHDNKKRANLAKEYMKNLAGLKRVKILDYNKMQFANFHLFVIRSKKRNELKNYLEKVGVQTGIHYPRLIPNQPFMKNMLYKVHELPESKQMASEVLTLPCHPWMKKENVVFICSAITDFLNKGF
jgi:dTDP-4-amino-4,6-dideoxygalactose transaminase